VSLAALEPSPCSKDLPDASPSRKEATSVGPDHGDGVAMDEAEEQVAISAAGWPGLHTS
jgi:hypothetical protein